MRPLQRILVCLAPVLACAHNWAGSLDSGALDATFGAAGKVQLVPSSGYVSPVANDVAVQTDGKVVVVGYEVNGIDGNEEWRITRLNAGGGADTTFGADHSGTVHYNSGSVGTRAQSVALRADGRIVVGGNYAPAASESWGIVMQLTTTGALDPTFAAGSGYLIATPQAGDNIYVSRLLIQSDGHIDFAGTYYNNQSGFNSNEFFFERIAADGSVTEPFGYLFGSGPNQDDHALDLAVDSQGRYVLCGYHRGASGNYDFAAIRIRNDLYDIDGGFGSGGQTTIDFGDNADYGNALALSETGYIALGGQANGQAALALLDPDGNLYRYFSGGLLYSARYTFAFGNGGGNDTIAKLIFDDYDTQYPQLLAIGTGSQSGVPYGLMFGVARLNFPGTYANFTLDTEFSGSGAEGIYFQKRPDGLGLMTTTNHGRSAAFAGGKLVVVGDTTATGGTDMAVARLAAFDGIFKNGYDAPSL